MLAQSRRSPAMSWIAVADQAHQDRLKHPVLAERVGQRGDLGGGEMPAGLERIRVDLIDGRVNQLAILRANSARSPLLRVRAGLPTRVPSVVYSRSMTSMTSSV